VRGGLDVEAGVALGLGERGAAREGAGRIAADQERRDGTQSQRGAEEDDLADPAGMRDGFPRSRRPPMVLAQRRFHPGSQRSHRARCGSSRAD
jgi:hypothetical protein